MPVTRLTTNFELENPERFIGDFHEILKEICNIPKHDRLIILDQNIKGFYQPTDTEGKYFLVEIFLFPGREIEVKRRLYQTIVEFAEKFGVAKNNVRIVLNDIPKENWGIRGGIAGCDI